MGYTFSTDQQSIIDARNQNILVSAAAGSGKTSVLTERIVNLVNDPVNPIDIDRILVVTFTNAAAAEMKERIAKRLNALVAANPENEHLQKQTTLIHGAQITTIDSFCLYLLKNNFHKIDVDPSFRIAGEGEMKLLKQDVLKDVIRRAYESGDEDFYHIVDCYSKKDSDDSLENSIMQIFGYAMSYPWPEKWLEERREDYNFSSADAFEVSDLIKKIRADIAVKIDEALALTEIAKAKSLLPDGPYTYEGTVNSDAELIRGIKDKLDNITFDALRDCISIKFPTIKRAPSDCNMDIADEVKGIRNAYKDILDDIRKKYFSFDIKTAYADAKETNRTVNKLIDLVEDFINSFDAEKRSRGVIDFSDMEHMAVKILISDYEDENHYMITDVATALRDYYEEVMVDEYQDSNLVQELIIQSVSKEKLNSGKNRFMVGDVKQSIYRFRLARPEIFAGKTEKYKKGETEPERLITLKQNFRSRQCVIDSVNAVFENVMTKELGGIDYDEDARLYRGGTFDEDTPDKRTELCLVRQEGSAAEAREAEADAIALKILSEIKNTKLYDGEGKRAASYKDVAVLFRAPSKWRDALKASFEKYSIPYRLEGVGAFYDTSEIREIISFLKILDNPLDDISLFAAMNSSFGHFSDEECARIKGSASGAERFLWDKLRLYRDTHVEDEKVSSFIALVDKYRKLSAVLPIHELITRLFDETGYKHIVAALPGGRQRLANVEMLITKASEYAKTSFYGLFHFLRYVELMKKLDEDEGEANTFDETTDAVRVLSIHKSKGLEFPICIIGGVDESFNEADFKKEFVCDIDEGIGAAFIDPERRIKRNTLKKSYIIEKSKKEAAGEEIRVLYVGMTRAKEKLILFGASKNPEEWIEKLNVKEKNSYLACLQKAVIDNLDSLFTFNIIDSLDNEVGNAKEEIDLCSLADELATEANHVPQELYNQLKERFSFNYPHEGLANLYTKTTVSELKMAAIELRKEEGEASHPFEENESKEYVPIFAGGELEVKGTDRGTAYHNLLQQLDFKKLAGGGDTKEFLTSEIARIISEEEMSREDVEKVSKEKIEAFLKSKAAMDMALADSLGNLYKEQPFVIGVPASSVDESFPSDETLLVQGVIDVYYILDGKVTVLDYKTDRVDSAAELVERYRKQLEYYGAAINQLTGLEVDKMLIYSFRLNSEILIEK